MMGWAILGGAGLAVLLLVGVFFIIVVLPILQEALHDGAAIFRNLGKYSR